jgi:hypothetical protein
MARPGGVGVSPASSSETEESGKSKSISLFFS